MTATSGPVVANPHFASLRYVATVQVMLLISAFAGLTFPVVWGAIVEARAYDLADLGSLQVINGIVGSIVGIGLVVYLQKLDRRVVVIICGLTGAAVEVATMFAVDINAFLSVRAFGAAASSVAGIVGLVYLSYTPEPTRTFAWFTTFQTLVQGLGLFLVPQINKHLGLDGLLMVQAALGLSVALCAMTLPTIPSAQFIRDPSATVSPIPWVPAVPALLAWLAFGFFTADFFNYTERFGNARGITLEEVGTILAVTTLLGLPASLFVSWLGNRIGTVIPVLMGGAAGLFASLLFLWPELGVPGYWAALIIFNLVWSFVYPYLLSLVSEIDPVGRLMIATLPAREVTRVFLAFGLREATVQHGLPAAAWLAGLAIVICPLMVVLALYLNDRRRRRVSSAS